MSKLLERFERDLSIRNYSKSTIRAYTSAMDFLSQYFDCCPADIGVDQIRNYLFHLQSQGKSWSTINNMLSACNIFYRDTLHQPEKVQKLKRPKGQHTLPVVLSAQEVAQILASMTNLKHKTIIATIYAAGLRVGELCALDICDIDSARMRIRIRNAKGHKDREAPLSADLLKLLRVYYRAYRPQEYLIEGRSIDQVPQRYSTSSIGKIFQRSLAKAGIQKKATVHTLRHSYATHLLNKGIDIRIIQRLLGHKSVKTTMIYCHLARDQFDAAGSPLDDLKHW